MRPSLRCLVVDDEALARQRLVRQLAEVGEPTCLVVAQAANAVQAVSAWQLYHPEVVFLDIRMPGLDGLELAARLKQLGATCHVVFVTAHSEHAVDAFALHAADYLTKPVKAQRLQDCVKRIASLATPPERPEPAIPTVLVSDAHRSYRLDLREVLLLKAELKYVSALTDEGEHVLSQSLTEIESNWPMLFVRTHRNALVRRSAIQTLERGHGVSLDDDAESPSDVWQLRLKGYPQPVPVSRRQLPSVRQTLRDLGLSS